MACKDRKWIAMNQELSKALRKAKAWKTFLMRKVKFYAKEWTTQVLQTQEELYQQVH